MSILRPGYEGVLSGLSKIRNPVFGEAREESLAESNSGASGGPTTIYCQTPVDHIPELTAPTPADPPAPVYNVNVVLQNNSTVNCAPPAPPPLPRRKRALYGLMSFWSSKINRCFVLFLMAMSFKLYSSYNEHQRRMLELDRRIDANPFLKLIQLLP